MRGTALVGAALLAGLPAPARADPAAAFVTANIVATLYHETGHALIALRKIDVPGGEEDAADALAALLTDRLHDEDAAQALIRQVAGAWRLYAAQGAAGGQPWLYGDAHSLDLTRAVNLVCLYYGADPGARAAFAAEQGLTPARRAACPAAARAAAETWDRWLDGMPPQDHGPGLRLAVPPERDALTATVAAEVRRLNGEYGLPVPVDVTVEPCGEANAFYDPRARRIVICTEYAAELARLFATGPDPSRADP